MRTSLALAFALVVALSGCQSYRSVPLANIVPKDQVRVTVRDGQRVEVYATRVAADTLRGLGADQRFLQFGSDSVAVAVADLTKVEVRRLNVSRSVVAGAAAASFVYGVLYYVVGGFFRGLSS